MLIAIISKYTIFHTTYHYFVILNALSSLSCSEIIDLGYSSSYPNFFSILSKSSYEPEEESTIIILVCNSQMMYSVISRKHIFKKCEKLTGKNFLQQTCRKS
jgi:hypothetical protein